MLDPISLLAGAGILVGGYGAGRVGRLRRAPKPKPDPKPICICRHGISFHTDGTGACMWKDEPFYKSGVGMIKPKCECLHYAGPTVYPTYISEIGG